MSQTQYLVLDLETIPDMAAAELLIPDGRSMTDRELREALGARYAKPAQSPAEAFVKSVMQKIVAVGVLGMDEGGAETLTSRAFVRPDYDEREALEELDDMITADTVIVTFNGHGFDLPVLRYRAMALEVRMPNLLSGSAPFAQTRGRQRNYFHRFGVDHIDLMDRLSNYGAATRPALDEALAIIGLRAKDGVHGGDVEQLARDGDWSRIAEYVKRDVEMTAELFREWRHVTRPANEYRMPRSGCSRHHPDC
jgi:predicted PolB exonuclease-like 3'-5' exonuclease